MKPVNLIPQDQRRRVASEGGGNGATIALGVLAALLAMVVVYVLTSNTITERQDDSKAASAEADRLEAQASQEANYTDFAQIAQTRMQSVAGVAATRFDWERFMRELAHVMPEGSWLQSADASTLGDPTTGASQPSPSTPATRRGQHPRREPDRVHPRPGRRRPDDGAAARALPGGRRPAQRVGCGHSQRGARASRAAASSTPST